MIGETATRLALAPVLLAQALRVRRTALVLPEPSGPRAGTAGDGPPLRLLILGDSSAAGVGATHQSRALSGRLAAALAQRHRLSWRLEARSGATSASALAALAALPDGRYDVAVVVLGVNDITRAVPLWRFLARRRALHGLLATRFRCTRIIATGLPPMGRFPLLPQPLRHTLGRSATRFDSALARLCGTDPACTHVPLDLPFSPDMVAPDGFHPSEAAYAALAGLLANRLIGETP